MNHPFNSRLYKHKKTGVIYEFMLLARREADGADCAVYRSTATNTVWVRPLSEFNDKFVTHDTGPLGKWGESEQRQE